MLIFCGEYRVSDRRKGDAIMGKTVYKTDYFKCTLSTTRKFNEQLQQALDKHAVDGWKLHSWRIFPAGEACVLVFFREEE